MRKIWPDTRCLPRHGEGDAASCSKLRFLGVWRFLAACRRSSALRGDGGCLADTGLFLRRFLQHGVGRVIGRVGAPIFFHSQPDQNCQHNEANDPFFLSCENEHQLRRGFT